MIITFFMYFLLFRINYLSSSSYQESIFRLLNYFIFTNNRKDENTVYVE